MGPEVTVWSSLHFASKGIHRWRLFFPKTAKSVDKRYWILMHGCRTNLSVRKEWFVSGKLAYFEVWTHYLILKRYALTFIPFNVQPVFILRVNRKSFSLVIFYISLLYFIKCFFHGESPHVVFLFFSLHGIFFFFQAVSGLWKSWMFISVVSIWYIPNASVTDLVTDLVHQIWNPPNFTKSKRLKHFSKDFKDKLNPLKCGFCTA